MPDPSARRWLSIAEAADLLGVSTKTASRWATRGALPVLRIAHTVRIDAIALEDLPPAASGRR